MTRRPKSRLPPKLADPATEQGPRVPKGPSRGDRLKREHVAGRSTRFGRDEIVGVMRRLTLGAPAPRLGLPAFGELPLPHVEAAMVAIYGWTGDGPKARIGPTRTIDGFTAGSDRILEVAASGGRLAFATARPASLHPLYRALARAAAAAGGEILAAETASVAGAGDRQLWWIDRVAVLTDHASLLGVDSVEAGQEMLFALPQPDLVVADRTFAGVALAAGLEVVAFADLDAVALAVAAWQGRSIRVIPLADSRPPHAYLTLLELLGEAVAEPA